ncbi:hypothetical protein HO173_005155 [Letharia columbiana]|uniref:BD-FAE-like domain-containing protein n=1 Tax=Letharia columbiana TaxID=112416 RepID=A0A8H6FY00_9LECA|nr:uncharacterized protein HO173_005155 [Letharia columbiana]KAF6236864.1 hypothetical protein HO173_005155 [Letharia columbiana]
MVYIHGGAFRDPLVSSLSLTPSLPALFQNPHVAGIASLNYRLSPHPTHPTDPSDPCDGARNAEWPDAIEDVRDAIRWLKKEEGLGGGEWIVCGHSVGGTMAVMVGMDGTGGGGDDGRGGKEGKEWERGVWGEEGGMDGLKAVVSLEGIYDFTACRDAHPRLRDMYDAFTTGAFGPEEEGGWERGDVLRCKRRVRDGVEAVVVGHSRDDELVEWEQGQRLIGVLEREREGEGEGEVVRLVEVEGKHSQVVRDGVAVGKCVNVAIRVLVEKARAKEGG